MNKSDCLSGFDNIFIEGEKYALELTQSVGRYQTEMQLSDLSVGRRIKSVSADFSTQVDRKSQQMLIDGIKGRFPQHGILAEEPENQDFLQDGNFRWVIDPLDGTTNYFQKQERFSISLAMEQRTALAYDTRVGVIHAARLGCTYSATRGRGANLNSSPIRVSQKSALSECVAHTNFPYDRSDRRTNNVKQVSSIIHQISNLRMTGCASLDLASVACGQADFYWEMYINLWDIAAGRLLVEEAGGATKIIPLPEHSPAMIVIAACSESILREVESILLTHS